MSVSTIRPLILAGIVIFALVLTACSDSVSKADAETAWEAAGLSSEQANCVVEDLQNSGLDNSQIKDIPSSTSSASLTDTEAEDSLNALAECVVAPVASGVGPDCVKPEFVSEITKQYGSPKEFFQKYAAGDITNDDLTKVGVTAGDKCATS